MGDHKKENKRAHGYRSMGVEHITSNQTIETRQKKKERVTRNFNITHSMEPKDNS